jgi:ribosomal protein S18 acetylase RimI-like enzyme
VHTLENQISQPTFVLREANHTDIKALVALENRCFSEDRLTTRNFRWMITKAHASLVIAEDQNGLLMGYILVLFHRGTSLARIYSLAVDHPYRKDGIARKLILHAEELARDRLCIFIRLEVRPDNQQAISLYHTCQYRIFGEFEDYYEDHSSALRYQKRILFPAPDSSFRIIPYYAQSTDFTCGPACMMMVFHSFRPDIEMNRILELRLWREATTIYMSAGHGGCGPHGLALAAWRRGFKVKLHINQEGPLFLEGVRQEQKKEVLKIVHEDFIQQLSETDIDLTIGEISIEEIRQEMRLGYIPVVLISSYRLTNSKSPHWVILSAVDDHFFYLHDPDIDEDMHKTQTDNVFVPVPLAEFSKMFKFGQSGLRTVLFISDPA